MWPLLSIVFCFRFQTKMAFIISLERQHRPIRVRHHLVQVLRTIPRRSRRRSGSGTNLSQKTGAVGSGQTPRVLMAVVARFPKRLRNKLQGNFNYFNYTDSLQTEYYVVSQFCLPKSLLNSQVLVCMAS